MQWTGPEDFALNALSVRRGRVAEDDLDIKVRLAEMYAAREAVGREFGAHPCKPLHAISPQELRDFRDWHAFEAVRMRAKSPAQSEWHAKSALQLEELASKRQGFNS